MVDNPKFIVWHTLVSKPGPLPLCCKAPDATLSLVDGLSMGEGGSRFTSTVESMKGEQPVECRISSQSDTPIEVRLVDGACTNTSCSFYSRRIK